MSQFRPFHGTPRVEDQHPDIFPGSPMALVDVFTQCLQARFSGDNARELPYVWSPDPQPLEQEGATRLYIESQFTEEPNARDRTPALLVEKGYTQTQKVFVGNRVDIDLPTRTELFAAWATVPISVLCIGASRGNSATLGDVVLAYLLGSTNQIREAFNIHEITLPTLSDTQPYRQSGSHVEAWTTTLSMNVMIKFMWRTRPIAPVLREIAAKMNFGTGVTHELTAIDLRNAR